MSDGLEEVGVGASLGLAQKGLHFAPHHFDGIEVRGVGGQETNFGSGLPDEFEGLVVFMGPEVVQDDDAGPKLRHEDQSVPTRQRGAPRNPDT